MKMALQKFAHGAHQYGNFKRTALHVYENALHYDNKIPSTSKFMQISKTIVSDIKKLT